VAGVVTGIVDVVKGVGLEDITVDALPENCVGSGMVVVSGVGLYVDVYGTSVVVVRDPGDGGAVDVAEFWSVVIGVESIGVVVDRPQFTAVVSGE